MRTSVRLCLRGYLVSLMAVAAVAVPGVGCDPGAPGDELPTDEVSSELRSSYVVRDGAGRPLDDCSGLVGASGDWRASSIPDQPDLVLVEHDGVPVCVDSVQAAAEMAAQVGLHLQMDIAPTTPGDPDGDGANPTPGRPTGDRGRATGVCGDDPIPLGKQLGMQPLQPPR